MGAIQTQRKSDAAIAQYVASLRIGTEYATCLVRFGPVFFGLGQVVLAAALFGTLPLWWVVPIALPGLAAMVFTMVFSDNLEHYRSMFHMNALWLIATGFMLIRF